MADSTFPEGNSSALNTSLFNLSSVFTNTSETTDSMFFQEPSWMKTLRLCLEGMIFFAGVFGNFLVCLITARHRNIQIPANFFILVLALSDSGILLVCLPLVIIKSDFPYSWPFGKIGCTLIPSLTDIFYGISIGCITAISLHRYQVLTFCTSSHFSNKGLKLIIFGIFIFSFVFISLPLIFVMGLETTPTGMTECYALWPNPTIEATYYICLICLFYCLPLVLICITYIKIRLRLRESSEFHRHIREKMHQSKKSRREAQNEHALRVLTPVVIVFALTMCPIHVMRIVIVFAPSLKMFRYIGTIYNISVLFLLTNSSANPVIYSIVSKEFRRDFKTYLQCKAGISLSFTTMSYRLSKTSLKSSPLQEGRITRLGSSRRKARVDTANQIQLAAVVNMELNQ